MLLQRGGSGHIDAIACSTGEDESPGGAACLAHRFGQLPLVPGVGPRAEMDAILRRYSADDITSMMGLFQTRVMVWPLVEDAFSLLATPPRVPQKGAYIVQMAVGAKDSIDPGSFRVKGRRGFLYFLLHFFLSVVHVLCSSEGLISFFEGVGLQLQTLQNAQFLK